MSSSIRAPLPPGIPATRTHVEQEILKAIDAASETQDRKVALWRLALFYHEQAKRSDLAGAVLQLMIQEFDDPLENPYSGSQVHIDRGVRSWPSARQAGAAGKEVREGERECQW
jgi:hypothetical protein